MASNEKQLRYLYLVALGILACLSLASHITLNKVDRAVKTDGHIINVAGRQRMLSQKIASESLQLQDSLFLMSEPGYADARQRLNHTLTTWVNSHYYLNNRTFLNSLSDKYQVSAAEKLSLLGAKIHEIQTLVQQLPQEINVASSQAQTAQITPLIKQIVAQTNTFLPQMNELVSFYEHDLADRVALGHWVETVIFYASILGLIAVAFFIFEPAIRKIGRQKQSLEIMQRALDTHTIFSVADLNGRIIDVNEGFCRISGYSREELIGQTHALLNSHHHPKTFWQHMWRTISTGESWRNQVCNRAKDGSFYWVDSTIVPQFNDRGRVESYISWRLDITDQVRSERESERARANLESIVSASTQVSIIATDVKGIVTLFNSGAENMLGYRSDEVVGKQTPMLWHDSAEIRTRCNELSLEYDQEVDGFSAFVLPTIKGMHDQRRWTYIHKDGTRTPVILTVTAVKDHTGQIQGFLGVAKDITAQLHAEEMLEQKHSELQSIVDAIPAYVYYKDANNTILNCNKAAANSVGLPRSEIINRPTEAFSQAFRSEEHAKKYMRDDIDVMESQTPKLGMLMEQWDANGRLRHLLTDKIPLQSVNGHYDRLVSISTDITDYREMEIALRTSEQRFTAAANGASVGIWDWLDISKDGEWWSPVFYQLLGYDNQEVAGSVKHLMGLMHPDDKKSAFITVERYAQKHEPFARKVRLKHKIKGYRWFLITGQSMHSDEGNPSRMIGSLMDIHDQVEAVAAAEAANLRLQESQERFELALEGSRDVIFDWNITAGTLHYSHRIRELLANGNFDLDRHGEDVLEHVAPQHAQRVQEELQEFLTSHHTEFESEFEILTEKNNKVWVLMRAAVIRDTAGIALRLSGSFADISSLKQAEEQLQRLVQEDQLTGLVSRTHLMDRLKLALARSRRSGKNCAVLFFDFDRFKVVNDSLGHDVGDELLCSIADRLRHNIREVDTAARFGGDEFVILLEDLNDTSDAQLVAKKLLDACALPHEIRGHNLTSTASIGIITNQHGNIDGHELIKYADVAMYEAKRNGRGCYVEFDQCMFEEQLELLKLEEDLKVAQAKSQLALVYQPIIDLGSGSFIAAEALIRWHHPEKGLIGPDRFIPIAEESNQIDDIGRWVIEQACKKLADWRQRDIVSKDFAVSLNVSKAQLLANGFTTYLVNTIDRYGLPRNSIKVEVTETTVVDNRADIGVMLQELRNHSIIIMMDDFGTGHSSLSGLHALPIDELKIDRSFITNALKNQDLTAIISSIVTLAEHLDLTTIGEGIETAEDAALLQSIGCDYGQGYLWSKPITPEEFELFVIDKLGNRASA